MKLRSKQLLDVMTEAAKAAVADRWPMLQAVAEHEFRKLTLTLSEVQRMQANGTVDQKHASRLVSMQRNHVRSVLATVPGLGTLTADKATHAATRAIAADVNKAAGFNLL